MFLSPEGEFLKARKNQVDNKKNQIIRYIGMFLDSQEKNNPGENRDYLSSPGVKSFNFLGK